MDFSGSRFFAMQNRGRKRFAAIILSLLFAIVPPALGDEPPAIVDKTHRLFFMKFNDNRTMTERMLNIAGLTDQEYGRSFALIAGVGRYNFLGGTGDLTPAAEDVRKLSNYLSNIENFDEIVVLQDSAMTRKIRRFFWKGIFHLDLDNSLIRVSYSPIAGTAQQLARTAIY
jgi:hypothetical protein